MKAVSRQLIELLQQLSGFLGKLRGCLHDQGNVLIAAHVLVLQAGHALSLEPHPGAGLGSFLYIVQHLAVHGIHHHGAAEGRHGVRNGHIGIQVVILTVEVGILVHQHLHHQIAPRSSVKAGLTLFRNAHAHAAADARRNRNLNLLAAGGITAAAAGGALILDDLSAAAAIRAGLHVADGAEERLLRINHLSLAAALRAHLRARSRLGAGPAAGGAGVLQIQGQRLGRPEYRLHEADPHARADAGSLHRSARIASGSSASEQVPENISEHVAEVCAVKIESTAAEAAGSVKSGMPELVILPALLGIAQNGIGLRGLLELCRGLLPRIDVRMVFLGQLPVGLLDFLFCRAFADAQNLIIISLLFCHMRCSHTNCRNCVYMTQPGTVSRPGLQQFSAPPGVPLRRYTSR